MVGKRIRIPLMILVCLSRSFVAAAGSSEKDKYRFHLDVDVVRLSTTALDENGRWVTDLEKNDFTVYENGVQQEIQVFVREDVPVRMVVLLDVSSSMQQKMATAQEAAIRFIRSLGSGDSVKVVAFSRTVRTVVDFTSDFDRVDNALRQTKASGETPLYNALYVSLRELSPAPGRMERQVLVVLSDGEDTHSLIPVEDVVDLAHRSDVMIYGVSVLAVTDDPKNEKKSEARHYLQKLCTDSGGSALHAVEVEDLRNAYGRIAAELRSQYYIGYASNVDAEDPWRRIQVLSRRPGVRVRTRTGYYAARN